MLQLSVAVACPVLVGLVLALHEMVIVGGTVKTGMMLSVTVITWLPVAKLPAASVTIQVRVIVEFPTQDPAELTSLYVTVRLDAAVQLSDFTRTVPVIEGLEFTEQPPLV